MKVKSLLFSGWMLFSAVAGFGKDYKLWYDAPATVWEEALPLGNGRIGAVVYGNPLQEIYQLNEESTFIENEPSFTFIRYSRGDIPKVSRKALEKWE